MNCGNYSKIKEECRKHALEYMIEIYLKMLNEYENELGNAELPERVQEIKKYICTLGKSIKEAQEELKG